MKLNTEVIEQIMAERLLTKADVAHMANVSRATLSRVFANAEVSPKTAGLIAHGLQVDIKQII